MPNHSHATIIGHAGKDADVRYAASGDAVATVTVAVTRKRKDKETTTWWQVLTFGKPAEWAAEIKKGGIVFASGEPVLEEWTDKDGNKRQTLKLIASECVNLSRNPDKAPRKPEMYEKKEAWNNNEEDIPF